MNFNSLLTIISVLILSLTSCQKIEIVPENERTNLFDPNFQSDQWFMPTGIDSSYVGGIVYTYNLHFEFSDSSFLPGDYDEFDVVVKRIDSDEYWDTFKTGSTFNVAMMNHDRVSGKFNCSLALRGTDGDFISSNYFHISEW
ncbi:MAG: hypothetical protein ACI857_001020 [Arenicella sp.]|jgi:hypothetical protein